MKVIVIGGGLLGVSSAFYLNRAGCSVTLLERREGPALETSYANGGMLTPSMADPWNAPGIFWNLLRWLGREDSPFLLRPRAVPGMVGWGIGFLRNASRGRFRDNTLRNLRLASYSLDLLGRLRAELDPGYDGDARGTLKIFRDRRAMAQAGGVHELLARHGVSFRRLDAHEVVDVEPALGPVADRLAGGFFFPDDETGDAYLFTSALARCASEEGVVVRYRSSVDRIEATGDGIRVSAGGADHEADACVIAAGSYSLSLAATVGLRMPVRPVKGYSITVEPEGWTIPRVAVVDDSAHVGLTPLGSRLRVAGTAEFAGFDTALKAGRIDNLLRLLAHVYPQCPRPVADQVAAWAGLRPVCVDGVPLAGATRVPGVYLNTGHGHLGWTLALGSGKLLAAVITDATPDIDPEAYAPRRFGL